MIVVLSFPFHITAKCTTSSLLCPEIEPDFSNKYVVLNNLGIVHKKKQMPDKALEYFLQTLQLVPEDSNIIKNIDNEIYNIYRGYWDN